MPTPAEQNRANLERLAEAVRRATSRRPSSPRRSSPSRSQAADPSGWGGDNSFSPPTVWDYLRTALGDEKNEGACQRWVKTRSSADWSSAVNNLITAASLVSGEADTSKASHLSARIALWLGNLINMASPAELKRCMGGTGYKAVKEFAGYKDDDASILAKMLFERSIKEFEGSGKTPINLESLYPGNSLWAVAEKALAYKGLAETCLKKARDGVRYSKPDLALEYIGLAEKNLLKACGLYDATIKVVQNMDDAAFAKKNSYIAADYASALSSFGTICLLRIELDPVSVSKAEVELADSRLGAEVELADSRLGKAYKLVYKKIPSPALQVKVAAAGILCSRARLALELSYKETDDAKKHALIEQAEAYYEDALKEYGPMSGLKQEYMRTARAAALKDHAQLLYANYVGDYYCTDDKKQAAAKGKLEEAQTLLFEACSALSFMDDKGRSYDDKVQYAQTLNLRAEIEMALAGNDPASLTKAYDLVRAGGAYFRRGIDATVLPLGARVERAASEARLLSSLAFVKDAEPETADPAADPAQAPRVSAVISGPGPIAYSVRQNGEKWEVHAGTSVIAIVKDQGSAEKISSDFERLKPRSTEAKLVGGRSCIVDADYYEALTMAGADVSQAVLLYYEETEYPESFARLWGRASDTRFATELNYVLWGGRTMPGRAKELTVARRQVDHFIRHNGKNPEKLSIDGALKALDYLVKYLRSFGNEEAALAICSKFKAQPDILKTDRTKITGQVDSIISGTFAAADAVTQAAAGKWIVRVYINGKGFSFEFNEESPAQNAAAYLNALEQGSFKAQGRSLIDTASGNVILDCASEKEALDLVKSLNSAFGQNAPAEKPADAPAQGAPVAVNIAAFKGKIADLEKLEGLLNEELANAKTEGEKTAIKRYLDTARAAIIEAQLSIAHLTAKQKGEDATKLDTLIDTCRTLLGTVSKASIPLVEFTKIKDIFVDPAADILTFRTEITEADINKLTAASEIKDILSRALNYRDLTKTKDYQYLAVKIHLALVELYSENKDYASALASCKAAFAAVPAGSSSLWDCAIALGNVLIDKSGADAATALNTFNTLLGHDDKRGFTPEELNAYPLIGSVVPISNNNNEERLSQARVGRVRALFAMEIDTTTNTSVNACRMHHIQARKEAVEIINNEKTPPDIKVILLDKILESLDHRWEDESLIAKDNEVGLDISGQWEKLDKTDSIVLSENAKTVLNTEENELKNIPVMSLTE
ncbi:MAG: hypothetical protein WC490_05080 [Candidatus Margulisiibacteriota bacterium]